MLEDWNREVLKGFYSVFKAADANLQFVLLTGVTKFSQVSVFSGFNQPNDISMDEHYEALCGITEEELYSTFEEQIKAMAVRYKTTEEGMKYKLRELGNASQQNKLQIGIGFLKNGIKTFE